MMVEYAQVEGPSSSTYYEDDAGSSVASSLDRSSLMYDQYSYRSENKLLADDNSEETESESMRNAHLRRQLAMAQEEVRKLQAEIEGLHKNYKDQILQLNSEKQMLLEDIHKVIDEYETLEKSYKSQKKQTKKLSKQVTELTQERNDAILGAANALRGLSPSARRASLPNGPNLLPSGPSSQPSSPVAAKRSKAIEPNRAITARGLGSVQPMSLDDEYPKCETGSVVKSECSMTSEPAMGTQSTAASSNGEPGDYRKSRLSFSKLRRASPSPQKYMEGANGEWRNFTVPVPSHMIPRNVRRSSWGSKVFGTKLKSKHPKESEEGDESQVSDAAQSPTH